MVSINKLWFQGNDRKLLYYSQELPNPDKPTPFEVPLLEQYWQRTDGTPVDRETLLLALSNIEAVRIKATYTTHTALAACVHKLYLPFAKLIHHPLFNSMKLNEKTKIALYSFIFHPIIELINILS